MAKSSRKKNPHKVKRKRKVRDNNDFYLREQELNKLIAAFIRQYHSLSYPPDESEYNDMNKQRLEIKRLFSLQDGDLWKQSRRRKRFYHQQLNRFKYFYTAWKRFTYYIYLEQRYNMPTHLIQALTFYKKVTHNISYTIFTL